MHTRYAVRPVLDVDTGCKWKGGATTPQEVQNAVRAHIEVLDEPIEHAAANVLCERGRARTDQRPKRRRTAAAAAASLTATASTAIASSTGDATC